SSDLAATPNAAQPATPKILNDRIGNAPYRLREDRNSPDAISSTRKHVDGGRRRRGRRSVLLNARRSFVEKLLERGLRRRKTVRPRSALRGAGRSPTQAIGLAQQLIEALLDDRALGLSALFGQLSQLLDAGLDAGQFALAELLLDAELLGQRLGQLSLDAASLFVVLGRRVLGHELLRFMGQRTLGLSQFRRLRIVRFRGAKWRRDRRRIGGLTLIEIHAARRFRRGDRHLSRIWNGRSDLGLPDADRGV